MGASQTGSELYFFSLRKSFLLQLSGSPGKPTFLTKIIKDTKGMNHLIFGTKRVGLPRVGIICSQYGDKP